MSEIAKTIRGINVQIGAETTGLGKALDDVNKKSRDIATELRKVERALKFNPNDTVLLAQKQKLLSEQVAVTKEKLDKLKAAQAQVNEQFKKGEISEKAYRDFQRELVETESKLKHFEKQLAATQNTMSKYGKSMQDAGQKMTDIGKNLSMKVTAPLVGLGAVIAKTGMDFEAGMSEVGAISGATGKDLQALENLAKDLGATTKFSASEAASGLKFMAMAGWDTQQMMDGLPGVLDLAAASGEDLGKVSDIVTDAMTAFGMEAVRAGEFADTLAAAASNSNTNVGLLGESFKYVAPVAGALGYEAKDTATALGLMANAGIKGSQSGSALRTILTNLAKPTKQMQDAMNQYGISLTHTDGSMKSLDEVMLNLRRSLSGLTEAEQAAAAATIFGKEAMSGALAVINTSEEDYNKLSDSINNSAGAAARMSKEMQDNLQGRLTELKSAIEGAALQLYQAMLPALEKLVAVIQKMVNWFSNLNPGIQTAIVAVVGMVAAIGPLLLIFGPLLSAIGGLLTGLGAMSAAMATGATAVAGITAGFPALGAAITLATGPIGLAVVAVTALVAGGLAIKKALTQEAIPAIERFGDGVSETTQQAAGSFLDLNDEVTLAINQLSWSWQEVTGEMADKITNNVSKMASQVQGKLDEHHQKSLSKIQGFVNNSVSLTAEEQEEILKNVKQGHEDRKKEIADGEARIKEILTAASSGNRKLKKEEQEEINNIQQKMVEAGIQVLSENELESKAIMERMKAQAGEITAQQAAEVVQNSLEQKEKAIKSAEEQCDSVIKEIIRQRDEAGTITEEQATKLIEEATRQKDEAIAQAEEMHTRVILEAKTQAEEHINHVDWETGEIKTRWQVFSSNLIETWEEIKQNASTAWGNIGVAITEKVEEAKSGISEKWAEIKIGIIEIWSNLWEEAINWGSNIVQGLIDGITGKIADVWEAASNVANSIKDIVKNTLGIESPSKVMIEFGKNVSKGLAEGIDNKAEAVDGVMKKIVDAIKSAADTMLSDLSKAIQLTNAEFDLQIAKLGKTATETDKLRIELQRLQTQASNTRDKVEILTAAYEKSKLELGENADQTKDYYLELVKTQTELVKTEQAIGDTSAAIKEQTGVTKKLEDKLKDLSYQYEVSKLATGEASEETKKLYKEVLEAELAYQKLATQLGITTDKYKDQASAARDAASAAKEAATVPTPVDKGKDEEEPCPSRGVPGKDIIEDFFWNNFGMALPSDFEADFGMYSSQGDAEGWTSMWMEYYLGNATVRMEWIRDEPGRPWQFASVYEMAEGGIVTKPTTAIIGEAGESEAVLPLSKLQPMISHALINAITSLNSEQQIGIDYDRLGHAVAKNIKPSITQNNTFTSPKPLTPAETAKQNLRVSRRLAMEWGL